MHNLKSKYKIQEIDETKSWSQSIINLGHKEGPLTLMTEIPIVKKPVD